MGITRIKSYTDLEQSKKLAEFLPFESADMYWMHGKLDNVKQRPTPNIIGNDYDEPLWNDYDLPCWSLAALLSVLKTFTIPTTFSVKVSTPSLTKIENGYKLTYTGDYTSMINNDLDIEVPIESIAENAVNACYEMIIKLNKLKMY